MDDAGRPLQPPEASFSQEQLHTASTLLMNAGPSGDKVPSDLQPVLQWLQDLGLVENNEQWSYTALGKGRLLLGQRLVQPRALCSGRSLKDTQFSDMSTFQLLCWLEQQCGFRYSGSCVFFKKGFTFCLPLSQTPFLPQGT